MTQKPFSQEKAEPAAKAVQSNLPVPSGPRMEHDVLGSTKGRKRTPKGRTKQEDAGFAAQVLSGGEKRGLKGGPDTLDQAKSTYLKSEYSGPYDRRPKPGRITKTDI